MKKKVMVFLLIIVLSVTATVSFGSTYADNFIDKLLIIINYEEEQEEIDEFILAQQTAGNDVDETNFELCLIQNMYNKDLTQYRAVAYPYGINESTYNNQAQAAYSAGTMVYLYGHLTMNEYADFFEISEFGSNTGIYNEDSVKIKEAYQTFSDEQKDEYYEILGLSQQDNIQSLVCKIAANDSGIVEFLSYFNALNKESKPILYTLRATTIVKSEFNFVSYYSYGFATYCDYILYQNFDETDPNYDYFALRTNVWATNDNSSYPTATLENLDTYHSLPYSSDEIIECSPEERAGTSPQLSVQVGFGSGGGASVGFSFDVSDTRPAIDKTLDLNADICTWAYRRRLLFPPKLEGQVAVCLTSWASTGRLAAINVGYKSSHKRKYGHATDWYDGTWASIQVRYSY